MFQQTFITNFYKLLTSHQPFPLDIAFEQAKLTAQKHTFKNYLQLKNSIISADQDPDPDSLTQIDDEDDQYL